MAAVMVSDRDLNAEPAFLSRSDVLAEPYGMSRDVDDKGSILDPTGERPIECVSNLCLKTLAVALGFKCLQGLLDGVSHPLWRFRVVFEFNALLKAGYASLKNAKCTYGCYLEVDDKGMST